ncbi:WXG100 family type VII secretion target [uncultured Jatrophihabitans sp.]|uniref:WXG100 family type VII secretion target n=1 Tax=uncultured Jatrophihabitans sp. TaxID=1610747 RepID=UPI0035CC2D92
MSGYDVDPVELFAARGRVQEAAQDGRTELARLESLANDVFAGGWRGGAASAFHAGYTEWHEGVSTMLAALDTLAQALGDAGLDYERAEGTNTTGFHRMAS